MFEEIDRELIVTFFLKIFSFVFTSNSMTVRKAATAAAATVAPDVRQEIYKQCVETAVSTTNRLYDFRIREIDQIIDQYLEMIPSDLKTRKVATFSN